MLSFTQMPASTRSSECRNAAGFVDSNIQRKTRPAVSVGHFQDSLSSKSFFPGANFVANHTPRVVDDAGKDRLEDGQVGEIYIKSHFSMLGYLNNPIATAEAFAPGGWIRSGDVGYVKDFKWYVPDRKKDVIKVKGWQVSPTELEGVLLLHEDIIDAGVIGTQTANTFDGIPRGFVVRRPGSTVTENDVKIWMRERLVRYKQVDRVIFVTEIPRNPTGKILRRLLKEGQYTEEVAAAGEQVASPEVVVQKALVTGDGNSSPAAGYEHIAIPEAVVEEVIVAENGNPTPQATYKHITIPEAIFEEVIVTENGNASPAAAYEHIAVLEAVAQDVVVTENGNSSPPACEHIALPEAVSEKVVVAENGISMSVLPSEKSQG